MSWGRYVSLLTARAQRKWLKRFYFISPNSHWKDGGGCAVVQCWSQSRIFESCGLWSWVETIRLLKKVCHNDLHRLGTLFCHSAAAAALADSNFVFPLLQYERLGNVVTIVVHQAQVEACFRVPCFFSSFVMLFVYVCVCVCVCVCVFVWKKRLYTNIIPIYSSTFVGFKYVQKTSKNY